MDCDRGVYNHFNLSNIFLFFTFYQQIRINRVTMVFRNSPTNTTIPNVKMYWANYYDGSNLPSFEFNININNSANDGQHTMNINVISGNAVQFQYLRITMSNTNRILLSEVQFCGMQL